MPASGVGHRWHHLPSHPHTADGLVRGRLVRDSPERWGFGAGPQRVLGMSSYGTAWTLLYRLRTTKVRPRRDILRGDVEVDNLLRHPVRWPPKARGIGQDDGHHRRRVKESEGTRTLSDTDRFERPGSDVASIPPGQYRAGIHPAN